MVALLLLVILVAIVFALFPGIDQQMRNLIYIILAVIAVIMIIGLLFGWPLHAGWPFYERTIVR